MVAVTFRGEVGRAAVPCIASSAALATVFTADAKYMRYIGTGRRWN